MIEIEDYPVVAGRPVRLSAHLMRTFGSLALMSLAGCSGGGGERSGGSLPTNPNANFLDAIAEPTSPATATDWSSSREYMNSTGLAQLNAAEGYALRSGGLPGGQGVRIAIIDSGIDITHPDLGNLAPTSWIAGNESLVSESHATFVAGIAGASRTQSVNPNDIHGIAYRATLVNFQAARPSQTEANGFVSFSTPDLIDAIQAASGLSMGDEEFESDILNLSLGAPSSSDSTFSGILDAMREAADQGKIMVIAAGNEGVSFDPDDRLQPIFPAAYVDDIGIAGYAIAVGNLTATNEAAASSSLCGETQNYCLFAPGTSVQSTLDGGLYGVGSGTSFAAPYVAGAAAVVKAAFPGVSNRDVVNRLLLTAEDLGDPGVDSTFGRGLLDLEAAMAPVGPTGIPIGATIEGPTAAIESSSLRLGPGMSMNSAATALLERVLSIDAMGFPFPVNLGEVVDTTERDHGLTSFVNGGTGAVTSSGVGGTEVVAFLSEDSLANRAAQAASTSLRQLDEATATVPLRLSAVVTDHAEVFLALNDPSTARPQLDLALAALQPTLMSSGSFFASYDGLAQASNGGGVRFSPADGAEITASASISFNEGDRSQSAVQRVDLTQALPGGIDLQLGLGLMQEDDGFVGGQARGAFGEGTSARSQFLTVSLLGPVTPGVDWFASYSRGRSSIDEGEEALLGDWSTARSEAFAAGLVMRGLAKDDDGLTLMAGQPLRQEKVEATLELPVARTPEGIVVTAREQVDFAPEAREVATSIGYRLPFGQGNDHAISTLGFLRLNPDHDPDRKPVVGGGLTYRWRF